MNSDFVLTFISFLLVVLILSFSVKSNVYEYCYTYVTFDNVEETYCSEKLVCNFSNIFSPDTYCEIDDKYFLVKELSVEKNLIKTITPFEAFMEGLKNGN